MKKRFVVPLLAGTTLLSAGLLTFCSDFFEDPPRNEAGQVTASASSDVTMLAMGDCTGDLDEGDVDTADFVPCQDPHHFEVYASTLMTGDDFPGDKAAGRQADSFCSANFPTFTGIAFDDSRYTFYTLRPTASSWDDDDRRILCLVGDPSEEITGSLRGVRQ